MNNKSSRPKSINGKCENCGNDYGTCARIVSPRRASFYLCVKGKVDLSNPPRGGSARRKQWI